MTLAPTTRLLFDASCLFSAAASPGGGSSYTLSVCARGYLLAVVSPDILIEAERNIAAKCEVDVLRRYRWILEATPFMVLPSPTQEAVVPRESVFFEDAHVVASALAGQCDYLITLDRRLQHRVEQSGLVVTAVSPREFLQTVLPEHPAYRRIRQHD